MPLTPEQVEQEIERLGKVCRELSDRVLHLQRRVVELELAVYEDEVEQTSADE
jgi:hypothetical protein